MFSLATGVRLATRHTVRNSMYLSNAELSAIEAEIEQISAQAQSLDPENPDNYQAIEDHRARLDQYIATLGESYSRARRLEIGLRIV
ncbi:MAG: hypothetical protein ACK5QT_04215 [Oligoflexia bacterium]